MSEWLLIAGLAGLWTAVHLAHVRWLRRENERLRAELAARANGGGAGGAGETR